MKKIIRKILKEDRRQMFLDKIVQYMNNDLPFFYNLKDYGFYEQLSEEELNYVFSNIFEETVSVRDYGDTIYVDNENGDFIYSEYDNGVWAKYEYDENGNQIYIEDSDSWGKYEYDENDNEIYEERSDGFWQKWEYDENGNLIYHENSNGIWQKYEYVGNRRIYYEDSDGKLFDEKNNIYKWGRT